MASSALEQIQTSLSSLSLGELRYFPEIGSTNDEAMTWSTHGAPDFSLVIADTQTAGRGRLGRKWVTQPGSALAFSLILRPPADPATIPFFSPWGALAICEALEPLGLEAEIKWPNDVLLQRRKIAGILLESSWLGSVLQAVVVGIGINVAPSSVPPDAEVMYPASSVEGVLGHPLDRWQLLAGVLERMQAWRERLAAGADFFHAWEDRLAFRGEWVHVGDGTGPARLGRVDGLDPNGELRLTDQQGEVFRIHVGEISLRPA